MKLNGAVMEFIIGGGLAFTMVRRDFFKKFVKTLRPERDVLCYQTLVKMMNEAFERMITNMKNDFAQVENVCVTADLWSAAKRGFLGMTGTHLDENLNRKGYALCCARMKGSHTNDKIAEAMNLCHTQYDIKEKVKFGGAVTDNATNFVKVCRLVIFSFLEQAAL